MLIKSFYDMISENCALLQAKSIFTCMAGSTTNLSTFFLLNGITQDQQFQSKLPIPLFKKENVKNVKFLFFFSKKQNQVNLFLQFRLLNIFLVLNQLMKTC